MRDPQGCICSVCDQHVRLLIDGTLQRHREQGGGLLCRGSDRHPLVTEAQQSYPGSAH